MRKMLVADDTEINKSILYDIFASQYELIQTESSEAAFRILTGQYKDISVVLINEGIASRFSSDSVKTLSALKVFDNIPVILILDGENSHIKHNSLQMPFCDVISSPVNPYIAKRRVANMAELFSHKNELEQLVNEQTKKILEQNERLKTQQKKINTINNDMLDTLSTVIEYRDVESGRHIHRIRKFTELLLRVLAKKYPKYNLTEEKIELITSASSIHDIGKIAIPDSILLSPCRLTYDEFRVMKQHTIKGCEILEQLDAVEKNEYYSYCYDICRYHHEKWDGLGYPDRLVGDQIPIWAQVVSVADCYDALTSERPYKTAFSHEQAVDMIRTGACGAFSDEMMECFGAVLPQFKALAVEYADANHIYRSISGHSHQNYVSDTMEDHTRDIYLKMDRNDLIDTIEHQKKIMNENKKRDREILYRACDYFFEFDIVFDMMHERKGSIKDICGYIPKNYEEAVNVLSECCKESYRSRFSRTFRLQNIKDAADNECENVVLECLMDIGSGEYSSVRCSMIPITEDEKLVKVFLVMSELHESTVNSSKMSEQDSVTGLWNYSGIKREVDDYISFTGKNGCHSLILIDIDDFKKLNRQTDYKFGNDVLCDISELLKQQINYGNMLARIEDDNFIVFVNDCPDGEKRAEIAEDIFRCLHKSYELDGSGEKISVSATMGIATYPNDGADFDELFGNASRAVDIAKLNGKNMYLFYNRKMSENWELKKYDTDMKVNDDSVELIDKKKYFIPVVDSSSGMILSYDMLELHSSYLGMNESMTDNDGLDGNVTALSLSSLNRLFAEIYSFEQDDISLPEINMFTMFEGKDSGNVIDAIKRMLEKYPINTENICIMISHTMISSMTVNEITGFVSVMKSIGFKVGIYNVGISSISMNCFIEKLFDRAAFAGSFLQAVSDGIYNMNVLSELINYFAEAGAFSVLPGGIGEEFTDMLRVHTEISFGIHRKEFIPSEDMKIQMKASAVVSGYPILSHEHTAIIPSDRMYDEILIQTRSFVLEWMPRFDNIKLSDSFEKLYGYFPATEDFVRNIKNQAFVHAGDIAKFLEKMNKARSDKTDSEAFIRIYRKTDDSYVWNRVHFVIIRNAAQVPVKIIAVFTDISYERDSIIDDKKRDRTDFITNLYNKRATENKIKSYIYDEGSASGHAFILAEICGFELIERNLGTVFANAVLKEIAENIRELFRDSDIIGRSSGNRFIVLIKGMTSRDKISEKAEQICKIISNKYQSETGDIAINGKAGISVFPTDGSTYDELYSEAMKALYYAKHSIKHNACFASETPSSTRYLHP